MKLTGPQVLFTGAVPHDRVPEWLSASDMLVHPVLEEGSSNVLRESLACGVPVITSDIPVNHEFLDDSVSVLVNPIDIDQLRATIEALIDDPDRRRAMGQAALGKAKQWSSADRARKILEWIG